LSQPNFRETERKEDKAYSLSGIFNVHMPLLYREAEQKALVRLPKKIEKSSQFKSVSNVSTTSFTQLNEVALSAIPTDNSAIALAIAQSLNKSMRLLVVDGGDPIRSVKWSVQARRLA